MPIAPHGLLGRLFHKGVLLRWISATRAAQRIGRVTLRAQRYQARQLRAVTQEFCHLADDRLALPLVGSRSFLRPSGTDWSWRPAAWRLPAHPIGLAPAQDKARFGAEIGVFHDCPVGEIVLRQIRNRQETDIAPYGLRLETFGFRGTYLSVVVDLPPDSCADLRKQHILRLAITLQAERPLTIMARLNVKHGPNTEQILETVQPIGDEAIIDYDLATTQLNEKRIERIWIDLLIDPVPMNSITLRDWTICRFPRALM